MSRVRSISLLTAASAMVLMLAGCGGGMTDPVPEGTSNSSATSKQEETPGAAEQTAAPAGWVGGEVTTGLEWPAGWPEHFPRVGGEVIAANSDAAEGNFSVVMYVDEGVSAELISVLKAQGMTVITDEVSGETEMAALSDGTWRVDVIGVIQDGTERAHLRYMVQKD